MKQFRQHHTIILFLTFVLLTVCLTGCGKEKALEKYKADVETFITDISAINDNINSIDMSSETRVEDFLTYADELEEAFTWFAELEVPKQFSSVESLADDAGVYMSEAVSLYHQVFEADVLDPLLLDVASENYKRANKRISYIASILQGETPEDEGITVEYLDENMDE